MILDQAAAALQALQSRKSVQRLFFKGASHFLWIETGKAPLACAWDKTGNFRRKALLQFVACYAARLANC